MNITYKIDKIKKNRWLNIAFDVSKDDLYMYSEMGKETITYIADSFSNKTDIILEKLEQMHQTALSAGYEGIHIICEPSGGYESKLMILAHKLGEVRHEAKTDPVVSWIHRGYDEGRFKITGALPEEEGDQEGTEETFRESGERTSPSERRSESGDETSPQSGGDR